MEKILTVDLEKRTACIAIKDIPLYAIKHLPAMAKDIADEIGTLFALQNEGVYRTRNSTFETAPQGRGFPFSREKEIAMNEIMTDASRVRIDGRHESGDFVIQLRLPEIPSLNKS